MPETKLKNFILEANAGGIPITLDSMLAEYAKAVESVDANTTEINIVLNAKDFSNVLLSKPLQDVIDPVTRLDRLRTGFVGTMFANCILVTDGVFEPSVRFIERSEIVFTAIGATKRFTGET